MAATGFSSSAFPSFPFVVVLALACVQTMLASGPPFSGSPFLVPPGVFPAEDFDTEGFFDTTAGNRGGAYRETDVDIEADSRDEGGFNIAHVAATEFLEYTFNMIESGLYDIIATLSSLNQGGAFDLAVDGDTVVSVSFGPTGDWWNWQNFSRRTIEIEEGLHILRFTVTSNTLFNIDTMRIITSFPSVNIEAPASEAAILSSNIPTVIDASTFDALDGVVSVDFTLQGPGATDSELITITGSGPHTFSRLLPYGSYSVSAVVTDDDNLTGVSTPRVFHVRDPPRVTLRNGLFDGAAVLFGSDIDIEADIFISPDPGGVRTVEIASVTISVDGNLLVSGSVPPFATTFSTFGSGVYVIQVVATDTDGFTSVYDATVTVTSWNNLVVGANGTHDALLDATACGIKPEPTLPSFVETLYVTSTAVLAMLAQCPTSFRLAAPVGLLTLERSGIVAPGVGFGEFEISAARLSMIGPLEFPSPMSGHITISSTASGQPLELWFVHTSQITVSSAGSMTQDGTTALVATGGNLVATAQDDLLLRSSFNSATGVLDATSTEGSLHVRFGSTMRVDRASALLGNVTLESDMDIIDILDDTAGGIVVGRGAVNITAALGISAQGGTRVQGSTVLMDSSTITLDGDVHVSGSGSFSEHCPLQLRAATGPIRQVASSAVTAPLARCVWLNAPMAAIDFDSGLNTWNASARVLAWAGRRLALANVHDLRLGEGSVATDDLRLHSVTGSVFDAGSASNGVRVRSSGLLSASYVELHAGGAVHMMTTEIEEDDARVSLVSGGNADVSMGASVALVTGSTVGGSRLALQAQGGSLTDEGTFVLSGSNVNASFVANTMALDGLDVNEGGVVGVHTRLGGATLVNAGSFPLLVGNSFVDGGELHLTTGGALTAVGSVTVQRHGTPRLSVTVTGNDASHSVVMPDVRFTSGSGSMLLSVPGGDANVTVTAGFLQLEPTSYVGRSLVATTLSAGMGDGSSGVPSGPFITVGGDCSFSSAVGDITFVDLDCQGRISVVVPDEYSGTLWNRGDFFVHHETRLGGDAFFRSRTGSLRDATGTGPWVAGGALRVIAARDITLRAFEIGAGSTLFVKTFNGSAMVSHVGSSHLVLADGSTIQNGTLTIETGLGAISDAGSVFVYGDAVFVTTSGAGADISLDGIVFANVARGRLFVQTQSASAHVQAIGVPAIDIVATSSVSGGIFNVSVPQSSLGISPPTSSSVFVDQHLVAIAASMSLNSLALNSSGAILQLVSTGGSATAHVESGGAVQLRDCRINGDFAISHASSDIISARRELRVIGSDRIAVFVASAGQGTGHVDVRDLIFTSGEGTVQVVTASGDASVSVASSSMRLATGTLVHGRAEFSVTGGNLTVYENPSYDCVNVTSDVVFRTFGVMGSSPTLHVRALRVGGSIYLAAVGAATIESKGGDMRLGGGSAVAGHLQLFAENGNIVQAGPMQLTGGSPFIRASVSGKGNIDLIDLVGPTDLSVIYTHVTTNDGDVRLWSRSSVYLVLGSDVSGELRVESVAGNIRSSDQLARFSANCIVVQGDLIVTTWAPESDIVLQSIDGHGPLRPRAAGSLDVEFKNNLTVGVDGSFVGADARLTALSGTVTDVMDAAGAVMNISGTLFVIGEHGVTLQSIRFLSVSGNVVVRANGSVVIQSSGFGLAGQRAPLTVLPQSRVDGDAFFSADGNLRDVLGLTIVGQDRSVTLQSSFGDIEFAGGALFFSSGSGSMLIVAPLGYSHVSVGSSVWLSSGTNVAHMLDLRVDGTLRDAGPVIVGGVLRIVATGAVDLDSLVLSRGGLDPLEGSVFLNCQGGAQLTVLSGDITVQDGSDVLDQLSITTASGGSIQNNGSLTISGNDPCLSVRAMSNGVLNPASVDLSMLTLLGSDSLNVQAVTDNGDVTISLQDGSLVLKDTVHIMGKLSLTVMRGSLSDADVSGVVSVTGNAVFQTLAPGRSIALLQLNCSSSVRVHSASSLSIANIQSLLIAHGSSAAESATFVSARDISSDGRVEVGGALYVTSQNAGIDLVQLYLNNGGGSVFVSSAQSVSLRNVQPGSLLFAEGSSIHGDLNVTNAGPVGDLVSLRLLGADRTVTARVTVPGANVELDSLRFDGHGSVFVVTQERGNASIAADSSVSLVTGSVIGGDLSLSSSNGSVSDGATWNEATGGCTHGSVMANVVHGSVHLAATDAIVLAHTAVSGDVSFVGGTAVNIYSASALTIGHGSSASTDARLCAAGHITDGGSLSVGQALHVQSRAGHVRLGNLRLTSVTPHVRVSAEETSSLVNMGSTLMTVNGSIGNGDVELRSGGAITAEVVVHGPDRLVSVHADDAGSVLLNLHVMNATGGRVCVSTVEGDVAIDSVQSIWLDKGTTSVVGNLNIVSGHSIRSVGGGTNDAVTVSASCSFISTSPVAPLDGGFVIDLSPLDCGGTIFVTIVAVDGSANITNQRDVHLADGCFFAGDVWVTSLAGAVVDQGLVALGGDFAVVAATSIVLDGFRMHGDDKHVEFHAGQTVNLIHNVTRDLHIKSSSARDRVRIKNAGAEIILDGELSLAGVEPTLILFGSTLVVEGVVADDIVLPNVFPPCIEMKIVSTEDATVGTLSGGIALSSESSVGGALSVTSAAHLVDSVLPLEGSFAVGDDVVLGLTGSARLSCFVDVRRLDAQGTIRIITPPDCNAIVGNQGTVEIDAGSFVGGNVTLRSAQGGIIDEGAWSVLGSVISLETCAATSLAGLIRLDDVSFVGSTGGALIRASSCRGDVFIANLNGDIVLPAGFTVNGALFLLASGSVSSLGRVVLGGALHIETTGADSNVVMEDLQFDSDVAYIRTCSVGGSVVLTVDRSVIISTVGCAIGGDLSVTASGSIWDDAGNRTNVGGSVLLRTLVSSEDIIFTDLSANGPVTIVTETLPAGSVVIETNSNLELGDGTMIGGNASFTARSGSIESLGTVTLSGTDTAFVVLELGASISLLGACISNPLFLSTAGLQFALGGNVVVRAAEACPVIVIRGGSTVAGDLTLEAQVSIEQSGPGGLTVAGRATLRSLTNTGDISLPDMSNAFGFLRVDADVVTLGSSINFVQSETWICNSATLRGPLSDLGVMVALVRDSADISRGDGSDVVWELPLNIGSDFQVFPVNNGAGNAARHVLALPLVPPNIAPVIGNRLTANKNVIKIGSGALSAIGSLVARKVDALDVLHLAVDTNRDGVADLAMPPVRFVVRGTHPCDVHDTFLHVESGPKSILTFGGIANVLADPKRMMMHLTRGREVDGTGQFAVGLAGEHSFDNMFDTVDLSHWNGAPYSSFRGLPARKVVLTKSLPSSPTATVTVEALSFCRAGRYRLHAGSVADTVVERGTVKFSVTVRDWTWCAAHGTAPCTDVRDWTCCSTVGDGEALELLMRFVSADSAGSVSFDANDALGFDFAGTALSLSREVSYDGVWDTTESITEDPVRAGDVTVRVRRRAQTASPTSPDARTIFYDPLLSFAPIDGGWSAFGVCLCVAGNVSLSGVQERTCTVPPPQFGGAFCSGDRRRVCSPCSNLLVNQQVDDNDDGELARRILIGIVAAFLFFALLVLCLWQKFCRKHVNEEHVVEDGSVPTVIHKPQREKRLPPSYESASRVGETAMPPQYDDRDGAGYLVAHRGGDEDEDLDVADDAASTASSEERAEGQLAHDWAVRETGDVGWSMPRRAPMDAADVQLHVGE